LPLSAEASAARAAGMEGAIMPSSKALRLPLLALILWAGVAAAQSPVYILRDLGTLPGDVSSVAWGINARGDVVGWSGSSPCHAFLYRDGAGMVALPGLPGQTFTLARGINDAGRVVGSGWGPGLARHAVRWSPGLAEDLGVLDGTSEGWDIGRTGVTVGSSPTLDDMAPHAFLHSDAGGMVNIAPAWSACAYDVNDVGQVAGSASAGAFLWSPESGPQALGSLDDLPFSHGLAVNISGQVAGDAVSATGNRQRVFRYTAGLGLVEIGGVGETNVAWGMNAQGSIVGEGRPSSGLKRAFLYTDAAGLQSLNEMVDASPQWFLLMATDINDAGQIVGYGFDNATGQSRAFRLDPVAAAAPLAHLAVSPVKLDGGVTATGWVTLTDPAPPGGANVALASAAPDLAAIPPAVLVPAGERNASFAVATTMPANLSTVLLTASYAGTVRSASLAILPPPVTAAPPRSGGAGLRILPPYPNPASAEARLLLESSFSGEGVVRAYDVRGRLVRSFRSWVPPGPSELVWDLRDAAGAILAPGVYVVELNAGGRRVATRIVVLSR
jgi:probable HAF family extracellular repeat protein